MAQLLRDTEVAAVHSRQLQQDLPLSALMGRRPPVIWLNVHRVMHLAIDRVVELSMSRRNFSCAVTSDRPSQSTRYPPRIQPQSTPQGYPRTMCELLVVTRPPLLLSAEVRRQCEQRVEFSAEQCGTGADINPWRGPSAPLADHPPTTDSSPCHCC